VITTKNDGTFLSCQLPVDGFQLILLPNGDWSTQMAIANW
jgi:hypothetical protein